jgi:hypothetical protein
MTTDNTASGERVKQLEELLARIAVKASGGLTQFSIAGKHLFLKDIAEMTKEWKP